MATFKDLLSAIISKLNCKVASVNGTTPDENGNVEVQSGVQSDWNENDETSLTFVKNRPFYDGIPVETEIIPETTFTFTFSDPEGVMRSRLPENFIPIEGETYHVSWDGTEYTCVCGLLGGVALYFGNLSIAGEGLDDTGEPFLVVNGEGCLIYTKDTLTEHTIVIKQSAAQINQIDKKYIPNSAFTDAEWDRISNKIVDYKQVNSSLSVIDKSIYVQPGSSNSSDTINTALIFENGKVYRVSGTAEFTNITFSVAFICNIDVTSTARNYEIYLGSFYDTAVRQDAKIYLHSSNSPFLAGKLSFISGISGYTYKFSLDITVHEEATVLPDMCLGDSIQRVGGDIIIPSSTAGSTKKFKITVDDSGTISATEVTG